MTRRKWTAFAAAVGVVVLTPTLAGAAPLAFEDYAKPAGFLGFCSDAQVDVANINESVLRSKGFSITSTVYDDEAEFVLSKSAVGVDDKTIITTSYVEYADGDRVEPKMYRCKLRTGESLTAGAWPNGADNNGGRFAVEPYFGFGSAASGVSTSSEDQPCRVVNERTIANVWDSLTNAQQNAAPFSPEGDPEDRTLVAVDDDVVGSGPEWTSSTEPVVVADDGEEDVLQVGSKSLVVPSGSAGVPRFEGAHYCTLVAPHHLRDILLGDVNVG